jgi:hypothetical protein
MLVRLSLFPPLKPARQVVLEAGREYLVGRGSECDLRLDDERISRRHARLAPIESGWQVADLGSKNGTRVDGRLVEEPLSLYEGAWLSFGGFPARFDLVSEEQSGREARQHLERWASTWAGAERAVGSEADVAELPRRLLGSILELTATERGFVLLARADGELEVAATGGLSEADLVEREFSGSVAAVDRVLSTGEAVVVSDARDDALLASRPSVVEGGIRALLCLPVKVQGRLAGAVYVDSRRRGAAFTELDVELLQAMSAHAGLALAVAGIDRELKALAARIGAEPEIDGSVRERLRRDAEATWERAFAPAGEPVERGGGTTWAALRAAREAAAGGHP